MLDHKKIVIHYLKTWFLIDFISSIPLASILRASGNVDDATSCLGNETKFLKCIRLVRLAKLMKLLRTSEVFRYLGDIHQCVALLYSGLLKDASMPPSHHSERLPLRDATR